MAMIVVSRTLRRPIRSPSQPKSSPPIGRATKPTARVANEASVEVRALSETKYCALNTSAAAVVKRKKSYHSIAVPTNAAIATLRAEVGGVEGSGRAGWMVGGLIGLTRSRGVGCSRFECLQCNRNGRPRKTANRNQQRATDCAFAHRVGGLPRGLTRH